MVNGSGLIVRRLLAAVSDFSPSKDAEFKDMQLCAVASLTPGFAHARQGGGTSPITISFRRFSLVFRTFSGVSCLLQAE